MNGIEQRSFDAIQGYWEGCCYIVFYFESEFQSIPQSVAVVSLFIKCKAINIKEIPGLFNTKSGGPLLQNYHQIVVRPKLFSLGCSTVEKISELLGSPGSWLDSNFKFSQIYQH